MDGEQTENGEIMIDDEQFKQRKTGVSFQKVLEDFVLQKQVTLIMDFLNITLTVGLSFIYVYRTYNMCYFDANPVWKLYFDDDREYVEVECKGEGHTWYYSLLLVSHIYFLLEFLLRFSVQKYQMKFLLTPESFIELFTTLPFLITLASSGRSSYIFQYFVMLDQVRLFLYGRFTKNI